VQNAINSTNITFYLTTSGCWTTTDN